MFRLLHGCNNDFAVVNPSVHLLPPIRRFSVVIFTSVVAAFTACVSHSACAHAIRPLAGDYITVAESSDSEHIPLFTPSIVRLDSGRLLVSYESGGSSRANNQPFTFILTSDDHGKTWQKRGETRIVHGRLFRAGKSLYLLGHAGNLRIVRSDDDGMTWSDSVDLTQGETWHGTAGGVWYAHGNVYLEMEQRVTSSIKTWPVGELAPVLLRARETDDLARRESWTFASRLPFFDLIPGYKDNDPEIEDFGVPFFPQNYPVTNHLPGKKMMCPMGWLEGNVVQILDPDHYWYDPTGHTFHLFLRAHTGGTGYAALAKVVENDDGTMTTSLERAPSGKKILFLPFPGGQMRFHVLYDDKTKLYWLLSSQATDSMTRTDRMPADRFDLPNNERNRLVLHFSKNMVDWCFAGVVTIGATDKESRHYACMAIDGDDLVIVSRSGDTHAKSAHNGNLITFHRVINFRNLVY